MFAFSLALIRSENIVPKSSQQYLKSVFYAFVQFNRIEEMGRRVFFVHLKIMEAIEESSCQSRKLKRKLTKRRFGIKRKGINTELAWKLVY